MIEVLKSPVVRWYWRPDELPERGDITEQKTDDQACQFIVIFDYRGRHYLLNYGWDTHAPVGTITARDVTGGLFPYTMLYYVLRSGPHSGPAGKLQEERRNLVDDIKEILNRIDAKVHFQQDANMVSLKLINVKAIGYQGNTQHSQGRSIGVFGRVSLLNTISPD